MAGRRRELAAAAVVLLVGCRDGDHASSSSAAPSSSTSSAASPSAEPKSSIAPVVRPLGGPSGREPVTRPDPHWADDVDATVALDETFLLELGMGSGRSGLNVTSIDRAGRAHHTYEHRERTPKGTDVTWRRVDFTVSDAELAQLVALLDEEKLLQLHREYSDPSVSDGAQWIIHLRTRGRDKYVALSNAFPEPALRIARFVTGLVDARPELADESRDAKRNDQHLWRWLEWYRGCSLDLDPVEDDRACMPLWVTAHLRASGALPAGAQVEAAIVDRSADGAELARAAGTMGGGAVMVNEAQVTLTVRHDQVDVSHRYELTTEVTDGDRTWRGEPQPVITFGEPYEVTVPVREQ